MLKPGWRALQTCSEAKRTRLRRRMVPLWSGWRLIWAVSLMVASLRELLQSSERCGTSQWESGIVGVFGPPRADAHWPPQRLCQPTFPPPPQLQITRHRPRVQTGKRLSLRLYARPQANSPGPSLLFSLPCSAWAFCTTATFVGSWLELVSPAGILPANVGCAIDHLTSLAGHRVRTELLNADAGFHVYACEKKTMSNKNLTCLPIACAACISN